jgi:hypothetical protein
MEGTVEVECPDSGEGTDASRTATLDAQVFYLWGTRLLGRFRRPSFPRPIGDNVRREMVVNQRDALSLLKS